MSDSLADRPCVQYPEGSPPLTSERRDALMREVDGWTVEEGHHLRKEWEFPDFLTALAFVNRAGEIAEAEQHHPEMILTWGKVAVEIWTHTVGGLSESDFILAAKLDRI